MIYLRYEDEDMVDSYEERSEDYYDLIELPNGKHIPVPIAKNLVGEKIIERIPVSHKVRDKKFFHCPSCDTMQQKMMYWHQDFGGPKVFVLDNRPPCDGYSFFRCNMHKSNNPKENEEKENMLVRLILGGLYKSLRYIYAEG